MQLTLDELKNNEDLIVESEGIKIIYEADIEYLLSNSIIDYSDRLFNRGFIVKGANLSSC